jgi:hypothetical protein
MLYHIWGPTLLFIFILLFPTAYKKSKFSRKIKTFAHSFVIITLPSLEIFMLHKNSTLSRDHFEVLSSLLGALSYANKPENF